MKLFYADHFVLPLPEGHRFPMEKYSRLRQRLRNDGEFDECDFRVPRAADDATLGLAHCPDYVARVSRGALTRQEIRRIGFPWSPEMVERSRRSAGATLEACRAALIDGVAANLAGGTHHAFRDRGEGFCVFNDAAVAARALRAEGRVQRIAIVDCDVHQGNGTASILANDDAVFTFSIHGAKNFPFHKETSDLDIELPDDTGDDTYLAALDDGLVQVFSRIDAQLVIYLAGADPFEDDRLGRLRLTKAGLARRDAQVLNACKARGIPLAVAMAGGYARNIDDTVDIHAATILTAQRLFA
ncbi:MAG: histone deacetylase [Rhodocyclaceae bacterium]|nr:histone deacetylase [Rhodocyclaceae bacterium]